MVTGFKYGNLNISRQGSQISVREDTGGRRSIPSTDYTISANEAGDHYEIRGTKDNNNLAWDLKVDSFGVEATDVSRRNAWSLSGNGESKSVHFMANVVRDYERAAYAVAGTIVGVPLDFLAKNS